MHTTIELLEAVKRQRGLTSDYQLSKALGVTRAAVSLYRTRGDVLSDELALHVAELAGLKPDYVLACVAAERSKSERARAVWRETAERLCIMLSRTRALLAL